MKRNAKKHEVESCCNAPDINTLLDTPALPLFSCRNCEFVRDCGDGHIGCFGKGERMDDGREGQWCTSFKFRTGEMQKG